MSKRIASLAGAVLAAILLVAGIAWAAGTDDSATTSTDNTTAARLDDGTGTQATTEASIEDGTEISTEVTAETSTSLDSEDTPSSTTTSVDDDDDAGSSTSTTVDDHHKGVDDNGATTTTLFEDDDGDGHPDHTDDGSGPVVAADQTASYQVAGIATVDLAVTAGDLVLVNIQADAGWDIDVKEASTREIKIRFSSSTSSEVNFKAELEHGTIRIDTEQGED